MVSQKSHLSKPLFRQSFATVVLDMWSYLVSISNEDENKTHKEYGNTKKRPINSQYHVQENQTLFMAENHSNIDGFVTHKWKHKHPKEINRNEEESTSTMLL